MPVRLSIPRYEEVLGIPGPRVITIANSERSSMACPRRWWFRYVEWLKTESSGPQRKGLAHHAGLEDVHLWWQAHDTTYPEGGDQSCVWCAGSGVPLTARAKVFETVPGVIEDPDHCPECDGTGEGPLLRYYRSLVAATSSSGHRLLTDEEVNEEFTRVVRWQQGWFHKYGRDPYKTLRVVGVEVPLARAILNPKTGKPFKPEVFVVHDGDTMRLAATGEASGAVALPAGVTLGKVRYPWYQVGRLDAVLQSRSAAKKLYVGEWKSSASPNELIKGLTVDPQTEGYCWLLEGAAEAGLIDGKIAGYMYDVTASSFHRDPKPLKRGGLSKSKTASTPSWRYEATLNGPLGLGEDKADYAEHIEWLKKHVDPRLFLREPGTSDQDGRDRYAEEVYSTARMASVKRRAAARATSDTDLNVHFPRVPVCRGGGFCSFRGPCISDGAEVRDSYLTGTGPVWAKGE